MEQTVYGILINHTFSVKLMIDLISTLINLIIQHLDLVSTRAKFLSIDVTNPGLATRLN